MGLWVILNEWGGEDRIEVGCLKSSMCWFVSILLGGGAKMG